MYPLGLGKCGTRAVGACPIDHYLAGHRSYYLRALAGTCQSHCHLGWEYLVRLLACAYAYSRQSLLRVNHDALKIYVYVMPSHDSSHVNVKAARSSRESIDLTARECPEGIRRYPNQQVHASQRRWPGSVI
jgi:hypothetical protein